MIAALGDHRHAVAERFEQIAGPDPGGHQHLIDIVPGYDDSSAVVDQVHAFADDPPAARLDRVFECRREPAEIGDLAAAGKADRTADRIGEEA